MDRPAQLSRRRTFLVNRLAQQIKNAPQSARADRHRNRAAGVFHAHPAHEAVGGRHGDTADDVVAEVLRHFHRKIDLATRVFNFQRVEQLRKLMRGKLGVNHRPLYLYDFTC